MDLNLKFLNSNPLFVTEPMSHQHRRIDFIKNIVSKFKISFRKFHKIYYNILGLKVTTIEDMMGNSLPIRANQVLFEIIIGLGPLCNDRTSSRLYHVKCMCMWNDYCACICVRAHELTRLCLTILYYENIIMMVNTSWHMI